MDLKQLVYDFKILEEQGKPVFYLKVCTGSTDNLKPELVLQAFYEFLSLEYQEFAFQIHRLAVYAQDEKQANDQRDGRDRPGEPAPQAFIKLHAHLLPADGAYAAKLVGFLRR